MLREIILFGKIISPYVILATIGFIVAGFYAMRLSARRGFDDNDMLALLLTSIVGAFFGGHLLYGISNLKLLSILLADLSVINSFQAFLDWFVSIFGGSVFYGGLLGGILIGFIYIKKRGLNLAAFSDMLAPAIPLFHVFGRIGCFLGGCCYGIESTLGFVYHHSSIAGAGGVSRFPVQLLESFINLLLFFALNGLLKGDKFKGCLLWIYLLCYSFVRFFLELLRGDEIRGFLWCFSMSQLISIAVFLTASTILLTKKLKSSK